jgi:hypothetical protein
MIDEICSKHYFRVLFFRSLSSQIRYARLAQLVEQRIENPCVRGSIPRAGTMFQKKLKPPFRVAFFLSLPEARGIMLMAASAAAALVGGSASS